MYGAIQVNKFGIKNDNTANTSTQIANVFPINVLKRVNDFITYPPKIIIHLILSENLKYTNVFLKVFS